MDRAAAGRTCRGRPQRTPYAVTGVGRSELVRRLDAQVRTPRREFPEFLSAVSQLGVLGPERAADALSERARRLAALIAEDRRRLDEALDGGSVSRLLVIEAEYALAMMRAERRWVLALVRDIASGRLAWPSPQRQDAGDGSRAAAHGAGRKP